MFVSACGGISTRMNLYCRLAEWCPRVATTRTDARSEHAIVRPPLRPMLSEREVSMYTMFRVPQPSSRRGVRKNVLGKFREELGYTALGNVFLNLRDG